MDSDAPMTEATEEVLARAVEENVYAMNRMMAKALGGELEENAQLSRYQWAAS